MLHVLSWLHHWLSPLITCFATPPPPPPTHNLATGLTVRARRNYYERCHFITQRSANVTHAMSLGNRCGFYSRRDVYRTSDLSCKGSIDCPSTIRHATLQLCCWCHITAWSSMQSSFSLVRSLNCSMQQPLQLLAAEYHHTLSQAFVNSVTLLALVLFPFGILHPLVLISFFC